MMETEFFMNREMLKLNIEWKSKYINSKIFSYVNKAKTKLLTELATGCGIKDTCYLYLPIIFKVSIS